MTYSWLLLLHGSLRWLVLLAGLIALARAWQGRRSLSWNLMDDVISTIFISILDTQLLLGACLYAVSPIRQAAYAVPSAALDNEMGFFAFLHPALMVIAIIIAHIGRALAKRADTPALKQSRTFAFYLAALAIMALAIPWWRPFLRF